MKTEQQAVTTDELLEVVVDPRRRLVLRYLCDNPGRAVTVGELADFLADDDAGSERADHRESKRIPLEHVHLPKMDAAGVIDFDGQTAELRSVPRQRVQSLLEFIDEEL